ncbi:hypothetical protein SNEBB_006058 [Seison nebaliae]|nr:hypothetical protein SNEBB_006058 [Seison nebaliae]
MIEKVGRIICRTNLINPVRFSSIYNVPKVHQFNRVIYEDDKSRRQSSNISNGIISKKIEQRIKDVIPTVFIEIVNESWRHKVPKNSETHFKLTVVSDRFEKMKMLDRHRLINNELNDCMENDGVHSIQIHTITPSIWYSNYYEKGLKLAENTQPPSCLGGIVREKLMKESLNKTEGS